MQLSDALRRVKQLLEDARLILNDPRFEKLAPTVTVGPEDIAALETLLETARATATHDPRSAPARSHDS